MVRGVIGREPHYPFVRDVFFRSGGANRRATCGARINGQGVQGAMTKAPKRPRDTNQLGKLMVDILTGQVEDASPTPEERGVDPAASAMGKKGGPARAASMTPERRPR